MNIFYLHPDPETCAQYHCDKHVVKMILEYSQMLSTAHHECDGVPGFLCYKPTHKNHPCAVWVRVNRQNYRWLWSLLTALCSEYTHRYGKIHATQGKGIVDNLRTPPKTLDEGTGMTPMPQCVPETRDDPVQAYRSYYKSDKAYMAKWKNRPEPNWW